MHARTRNVLIAILLAAVLSMDAKAQFNDSRGVTKHVQKALMAYPEAKEAKKGAERKLYQMSPIEKDKLVYFTPVMAIVDKKVSTSKFKNLEYRNEGLTVDPDLTYDWGEKYWNVTLGIKYDF